MCSDDLRDLPPPVQRGPTSVEQAIATRRSQRELSGKPLTPEQISQLCWAAQGITEPTHRLRASPSAGALYPIELYVVTAAAVDRYDPAGHRLVRHLEGDIRQGLQRASLNQEVIGEAPVCLVVAAAVDRMAHKYGERSQRYCFMEAGHIAQNVLLQAAALQLVGVPVAAFNDQDVAKALSLPRPQEALYLLPIGHPR